MPGLSDDVLRSRPEDARFDAEQLRFSEQAEVYWLIQGKLSESPVFGTGLKKTTGSVATTPRLGP